MLVAKVHCDLSCLFAEFPIKSCTLELFYPLQDYFGNQTCSLRDRLRCTGGQPAFYLRAFLGRQQLMNIVRQDARRPLATDGAYSFHG